MVNILLQQEPLLGIKLLKIDLKGIDRETIVNLLMTVMELGQLFINNVAEEFGTVSIVVQLRMGCVGKGSGNSKQQYKNNGTYSIFVNKIHDINSNTLFVGDGDEVR